MALWSDDFSGFSVEEVLRSQTENRAWHKELRVKSNELINSRLEKRISWDEYSVNRKLSEQDVAECKRRAARLLEEINVRYVPALPRFS